ncbi:MAG: DUF465 domain-containing protein [Nitrospirae bacterium]|nr:DUF465 domain-containing protein [Nitrospirota bacterium]
MEDKNMDIIEEDSDLINHIRETNEEYKKIEQLHHKLNEDLKKMGGRYLTPDEEMLKKNMQKDKLIKKDRMTQILKEYKIKMQKA